jgi:NitT/TauT family transport system ATP-binding protein
VITIRALSLTYESQDAIIPALDRVDLDIRAQEFVAIVGPSGCGKSTLLKVVADLLAPSAGAVFVDGKPPKMARANQQIGFIFQDSVLLPWKTVRKNVGFLTEVSRGRGSISQDTVDDLLSLVGLRGFEDRYPVELSGGMRQRVALARALALDPLILLMDEPFGALDEITRERLNAELLRIWSERRKTVLFVTHSISEAVFLSDRVVLLSPRPGRIAQIFEVPLPRPRRPDLRYSEAAWNTVASVHAALEEVSAGGEL